MIAATMFSGIGAPEQAMPGWDWKWHAEIEKFPATVLKHHHPNSINLGDVNAEDFAERAERAGRPDVLIFGSPCQSFSVAGRRLGLDDPRGNLALVALGIVARLKPRWFVFENVPGLLSSAEGSDFGIFLRTVDELGYSGAWSVLDAQYAGVAQRRERVFFVGHAGDWRGPAAVLFECESVCGHSPPRRQAGQGTAAAIEGGTDVGKSLKASDGGIDREDGHTLIPDIAWALQERDHKGVDSDTKDGHLLVLPVLEVGCRTGRDGHEAKDGLGIGAPGDPMFSLQSSKQHGVLAFDETQVTSKTNRSNPLPGEPSHYTREKDGAPSDVVPPLTKETDKGDQDPVMLAGSAVRRLTPTECERLMGLPDGYTAVTYRGKPAADGPRYKALGNTMAVPCIRWILSRIESVEEILSGHLYR